MKRLLLSSLILLISFYTSSVHAQSATVYASKTSGSWGDMTIWETYSNFTAALAGAVGTGTTATTIPSGTHNVLVRSGHTVTMGDAARGCKGVIIQSGGKLWGSGNTADRRLQIGAGGTGFAYPLIDTIQVDGVMGGPSDRMYIESGANSQQLKFFGSGTIDILRIRTPGNNAPVDPTTPGVFSLDIDINMNLWQTANYALSIVYNPAVTDNYSMTIFPGKTVSIKDPTGVFHNGQNILTYGKYTYNIKGTLDITANTGSTSINLVAPAPAASKITLNVDGGTLKLGTAFKADTSNTSPASAGVLDLNAKNGGIVDGSLTTSWNVGKTTDGAGGVRDLVFNTDATSFIRRTVAATEVNFPVGAAGTGTPNDVFISNAGVSDVFNVNVKTTFTNTVPDPTKTVNREWTINEAVAGGSVATVKLSWVTADQPAGFNPAGTVYVLRYNGTAWESYPATVTGTGALTDPYIATSTAPIVAFSPFAVSNVGALPLHLLSFNGSYGAQGAILNWKTTNEVNVSRFEIETNVNGREFASVGTTAAKNTGLTSTYSFTHPVRLSGTAFYRIKMIDKDASFTYSPIVKLGSIGKGDIAIAPNPVKGNLVNLQLSALSRGSYTVSVTNSIGQQVFTKSLSHEGGSATYQLQLPGSVKAGVYNLQIKDGETIINKKVVVE
jgi:hypothetical protein